MIKIKIKTTKFQDSGVGILSMIKSKSFSNLVASFRRESH